MDDRILYRRGHCTKRVHCQKRGLCIFKSSFVKGKVEGGGKGGGGGGG